MNLAEALYNINQFRAEAQAQEAKGETPKVAVKTFDLMEKMPDFIKRERSSA